LSCATTLMDTLTPTVRGIARGVDYGSMGDRGAAREDGEHLARTALRAADGT
jgi:hypothetical protein